MREDTMSTPLFSPTPSIMLVELGDEVRAWCKDVAPGITVLSVGHSLAARERAMVTRPLVIVIPDRDMDALDLQEVAAVTGAEIVRHLPTAGRDWFQSRVRAALAEAERRRRPPV